MECINMKQYLLMMLLGFAQDIRKGRDGPGKGIRDHGYGHHSFIYHICPYLCNSPIPVLLWFQPRGEPLACRPHSGSTIPPVAGSLLDLDCNTPEVGERLRLDWEGDLTQQGPSLGR